MMTRQPSHFKKPSSDCRLPDHEVHIWLADLNQPPATCRGAIETLSPDETARADRFMYERDRRRFIACRTALRSILANYLKTDARNIHFEYGKNGKPFLSEKNVSVNIQFNIAHSEAIALLAFTRNHAIGVDIEYVRNLPEMEQMAQRIFTANERIMFHSLPSDAKSKHFFRIWAAKEAVIKATGDGLSLPMNRFEVTPASGPMTRQLTPQDVFIGNRRWRIGAFPSLPCYEAAFAVEAHPFQTRFWQWTPASEFFHPGDIDAAAVSNPTHKPALSGQTGINACAG